MQLIPSLALAILGLAGVASAATPDEWRSRSIYQVLTDRFALANDSTVPCPDGFRGFCGGTWQGIIRQLPYIQSMGFDAIWISPITKQIDDSSRAFHGYSQQDLYSVNQNFGTEQDLKDLAAALHAKDMYLMVDVVTNHFGANGAADKIDFTQFNPFNSASDFHSWCTITNEDDLTQTTTCSLGAFTDPLPDVDTTSPSIRATYASWIKNLIFSYAIDGLRIDSVKNVEMTFWPSFQSAAGIYAVGEVSDGRIDHACPYQAPSGGALSGILNYPLFYSLTYFFNNTATTSTNLINLLQDMQTSCTDVNLLAPFSENHDQPRFANYTPSLALASNVLAFTLLADGIPIVYSGQEQHLSGGNDPYNREAIWLTGHKPTSLTALIATLNRLRKYAIQLSTKYTTDKSAIIASDDHTLTVRKGESGAQIVAVYSNLGEPQGGGSSKVTVPASSGFVANSAVMEMVGCKRSVVGAGGVLETEIEGGMPAVFFAEAWLKGSGVCGL